MPDTEKVIDKIKKLMSLAESEEALGNSGAAENIGAKAQELLLKYKLSHMDIKMVQEIEPDYIPPIMGKSIVVNPFVRVNARAKARMIWFEELAKTVAEGYFCKTNIENGEVWFYGLDMDREVAIYMFLKIAERARKIHDTEIEKIKKAVGMKKIGFGGRKVEQDLPKVWISDEAFTNSFHKGFKIALEESLAENVDHSDPAFIKSMEDIQRFINDNPPSYRHDYRYYQNSRYELQGFIVNDSTWDFAFDIGKKYGNRVSRKVSAIAESSTNEQLIATEKKNLIGEVYALLDDSGSMHGGTKLSELKDGVRAFASEAIAKGFTVGLIKFGKEATHLMTPQSKVNKSFIATLNKLDGSSGGTNMIPALRSAQSYFRNTRVKRTILLVTDGHCTDFGGDKSVIEVALELKRSGIEIMTIGCGSVNEEFLKRLASKATMGELVADADLGKGMKRMAGLLTA